MSTAKPSSCSWCRLAPPSGWPPPPLPRRNSPLPAACPPCSGAETPGPPRCGRRSRSWGKVLPPACPPACVTGRPRPGVKLSAVHLGQLYGKIPGKRVVLVYQTQLPVRGGKAPALAWEQEKPWAWAVPSGRPERKRPPPFGRREKGALPRWPKQFPDGCTEGPRKRRRPLQPFPPDHSEAFCLFAARGGGDIVASSIRLLFPASIS